jgi:hypothetical protein
LTQPKKFMNKNSSQTNLVVHKQKLTTLSSTKLRSKKLHCVGNELSIKKMWSGETKTGWITTTPHHTLIG